VICPVIPTLKSLSIFLGTRHFGFFPVEGRKKVMWYSRVSKGAPLQQLAFGWIFSHAHRTSAGSVSVSLEMFSKKFVMAREKVNADPRNKTVRNISIYPP